ncbi:MAG: hypothetical protein PHI35_01340 [Victivallaceae bacterium]|nr:hypothetical protein [Victivallaceae bacterium]
MEAGASPSSSFAWSLRRSEWFYRCRRGYFLRYYGASGGHDPDADPEIRKLHRLKNTFSSDGEYLDALFFRTLRSAFYDGISGGLAVRAAARLRRELDAMSSGVAGLDHTCPCLRETPDLAGVKRLTTALTARLDAFESGAWRCLAGLPMTRRLTVAFPQRITVNGVPVLIAPALVWRDDRFDLNVLEIAVSNLTVRVALHRFLAQELYSTPPERVKSWRIDGNGELAASDADLRLSAAVKRVMKESSEMISLLGEGQRAAAMDFPSEGDDCKNCVFDRFCQIHD